MANASTIGVLTTEPLASDDSMSASAILHGLDEGPIQIDVSANVPLNGGSGAWLPATLPMAMRHGMELRLAGPQDPIALENAAGVQSLLDSWYSNLRSIEIVSVSDPVPERLQQRGVGSFFSGGADSFYSAIERSEDITHLIFVTGFDIDVDDEALSQKALDGARGAAKSLGKELVEVRTNIRHMSEGLLDWGTHYHGAALATVGLLLGDVLERVIIPASYHTSDLFPWGSHPELDSLWNSSSVTFEHHGESATRPEQVERISKSDAAMDHLRICWENPGGAFNCGQCEKCIRTMVNLRVVGSLERCRTLPDAIDIQRLRSFRPEHGSAIFAKQNLEAMKTHGIEDKELTAALTWMVRTAPLWDAARTIKKAILRR
ncbi:hypothetical protein [Arthrobacter sp. HY1533]|uniref:hypothetical protein n=1 Tax=Arthrobacter sp. HY1533 TaxID=2970919 RepID=UPI0022B9E4FA|nr:hypothetical protein [Arthrobacter sp. HY1533]